MTSSDEADPPLGTLAGVQTWLRLVVTAPGGLRHGLALAFERYGAVSPVEVPPGVHPGERLAIYARGYLDRLLCCLRADFPAVRALLGDAMFDAFAMEYLAAHPPRGYSLFVLGAGFADHLASTAPVEREVPADRRALVQLPVDLARAERARLEALRAPGAEGMARDSAATGIEALFGDDIVVAAAPCVRVVALEHDVRDFLAAVDREETPTLPAPRSVLLAVSRVAYRVVWAEITLVQQRALAACVSPRPLSAITAEVAARTGGGASEVLAELLLWLPAAEALGLIIVGAAGRPESSSKARGGDQ